MVYVAGVDIGSAFSKAVVLANNKLISFSIIPSGANYKLAADEVMKERVRRGLTAQPTDADGYTTKNNIQ